MRILLCLALMVSGVLLPGCVTQDAQEKTDPRSHGLDAGTPRGIAERTADAITPYPLETCLVSGEDLDSMGGEIVKVYRGREVKFCCQSCVREFEASPARFLKTLS